MNAFYFNVYRHKQKPLSFKPLKKGWSVIESFQVGRGTDRAVYKFAPDKQDVIPRIIENTYFPHNIFKDISVTYWVELYLEDKKGLEYLSAKELPTNCIEAFSPYENGFFSFKFKDFNNAADFASKNKS